MHRSGSNKIKHLSRNPFRKKRNDDESGEASLVITNDVSQPDTSPSPLFSLNLTMSMGGDSDGVRPSTSVTTTTTTTTTDESSVPVSPLVVPANACSSGEAIPPDVAGGIVLPEATLRPASHSLNVPYGNAYMRPLNTSVFSEWKVPFCFLCGTDFGKEYVYIAVVRDTGYMYGCHEIEGIPVHNPVIYRQLYVCDECNERVICAGPRGGRVKIHPNAHTLFL